MDNVATLPVPNSTTATTASASASTSITATPPFTATPASTTTATSITTATPPSSPTSKPMAPPAAPATTTGVAQETKLPSIDTTADANRVPPSPIHSSAASVKSSKDSKPTSASNTGTYGWRTLLGYGAKSDEAQPSAESMDYMLPEGRDSSEIQRQYYQEGEEPQARRTFAELTEIKRRDAEKRDREQSQSESVASKVANKVLPKRKNMVLPGYYEQFEECKPSIFQNVIPQIEVTPENSGKGKGGHGKSPSIMKSAVNALSSFLFSKADAEPIPIQAEDNLQSGPHGIHKVAIIGVHGWFPTKLVRSVIGEPTGTSTKFCEEMDAAFKEYLKAYDIELQPENITLIPLEGEGKVLDRVDILYENLHKNSKWVEALREANVVFVATHSQGTPTSVLLMARLIKDGLLRCEPDDPTMQRIGVLAMAGISHGPFPYLKGNLIVRWFEAEAAGELFEFMDSDTEIAKKYHEGLRLILQSGIRVTCVASLEDQVVPLYSAVMTSVSHPSIVRAIYIDGASYQDDFLTHLISFSLRLRNAGVEDHGVLVHLSEVIAGSLYGEGHSTIYDEREVYMLSIRSLLEPPTSLTPEQARSEPILNPFRAKQRLNPFYLPWGMRGVMEQVKAQGDKVLNEEMDRLRKLYDEWNPVSKGLKEIKFRLEPVRSKL